MADEQKNIIISVSVDNTDAVAGIEEVKTKLDDVSDTPLDKPFKNFKQQIKEATLEAQKLEQQFGKNSTEFKNAAKKIGELKDNYQEFGNTVKAFNPDNKLAALTSAARGAVGAVQGVTGAMQFLGVESSGAQEAMAKLQGLMAFGDALDKVDDIKQGFKDFGRVLTTLPGIQKAVTAAQKLWNLAVAANPIGLLVTAIAALIAGGIALYSYFKSNEKAARENAKAIKENEQALNKQEKAQSKAADELNRSQNYQVAMAKANGETTQSIRTLEKKLQDEKVAFLESSRAAALNTYEKNKNALANLRASGAKEEQINAQKDVTDASLKYLNEQTNNLNKSYIDKVELTRRHNVEIATETKKATTDADNKEKERKTKNREATQKDNQQAIDDAKKFKEDYDNEITKLNGEILNSKNQQDLALIQDEELRAQTALQQEYNKQVDIYKEKYKGIKNQEELNTLLLKLDEKYYNDVLLIQKNGFIKRQESNQQEKDKQKGIDDAAAEKLRETRLAFDTETENLRKQNKYASMESGVEKELLILDDNFSKEKTALQKLLDTKIILEEEYQARLKLIIEKNAKEKSDIEIKWADLSTKQRINTAFELSDALINVGSQYATFQKDKAGEDKKAQIRAVKVQEAATIGGILLSTTKTVMKDAEKGFPLAIPFIAADIALGGLQAATAISASKKAISQINAAEPAGGSGGGGSSATPQLTAPTINATATAPQAIQDVRVTNQGQAPIRAFITDRDLRSNEQRTSFLNNLSTF